MIEKIDNKMEHLVPKYRIAKVEVRWTDGSTTVMSNPPTDVMTTPIRVLELEIARDLRKKFPVWHVIVVPQYL